MKALPLAKSNYAKKKIRRKKYKSPTSRQEKRMDDKFAILLKLKRNLTCEKCERIYNLTETNKIPRGCQCSHYFHRPKRATRWLYDNCFCHCGGCHMYLGQHSEIFHEWIITQGGHSQDSLDLLMLKSNQSKVDRSAIELWIDQELLQELPKWPRLNYPALEPIYEKLEEHNDSI